MAMALRTWRHLIHTGQYSYRNFVATVDAGINNIAAQRGSELRLPLLPSQYGNPSDDPMSLGSMVETPTRLPRPPVYFYYKEAGRRVMHLMKHGARLADELQYERRASSEEISELRSRLARRAA